MKLRSASGREGGAAGGGDAAKKPAPQRKQRPTGTKVDARTQLTVSGDSSLIKANGKGVTYTKMPAGRCGPPGSIPRMAQLAVEWGADSKTEEFYYGMATERVQSLLVSLNPAMSMAISRKNSQFSVMSGGSFLRILHKDGKVVGFCRR